MLAGLGVVIDEDDEGATFVELDIINADVAFVNKIATTEAVIAEIADIFCEIFLVSFEINGYDVIGYDGSSRNVFAVSVMFEIPCFSEVCVPMSSEGDVIFTAAIVITNRVFVMLYATVVAVEVAVVVNLSVVKATVVVTFVADVSVVALALVICRMVVVVLVVACPRVVVLVGACPRVVVVFVV